MPDALTARLAALTGDELGAVEVLFVARPLPDDLRAAFATYRQRLGLPPSDRLCLGADLAHIAREARRDGKQLYLYVYGY